MDNQLSSPADDARLTKARWGMAVLVTPRLGTSTASPKSVPLCPPDIALVLVSVATFPCLGSQDACDFALLCVFQPPNSSTGTIEGLIGAPRLLLGKEPEDNIHRVAYVELLLEYNSARDFAEKKSSAFLHAIPEDYDISQPGSKTHESVRSETQRLETRRRARERVKELDYELSEMELRLRIDSRWDPTMPRYHEALTYIKERRYHQALDALQKVVVQRLFELHRLNLSGIGYKARTLLAKAMRSRSRAIQSAVAKYNRAALDLGRSNTLDFAQAAKYSFVEEFELLKNTHADLSEARWKEPVVREAMKRHQRTQRAKEEVIRLNIEIQRLYTAIVDEEEELSRVVRRLQAEDDSLIVVLQDFACYRSRVHQVILSKLTKTAELPNYT